MLSTSQWPGYPDWRYENGIDVFDHTQQANPYTLGQIANKVARLVKTFYDVRQQLLMNRCDFEF